jgi:hypothetical protein
MESFKEPSRKKSPSAKSLNELMNLLMKLNAKLREKIVPARAKKENGPARATDVVIIIMSAQEEKSRPAKASRPGKPEPLKSDWIQGLCEDIERGPSTRE